MQRLLALSLTLSLTPVFSQDADSADACAARHPTLTVECASCFADNIGCNSLVTECNQLQVTAGTCELCYLDKNPIECAQLNADIAAAAAAACAARHPDFSDDCSVCFSGDSDAESCNILVAQCKQLGGSEPACIGCYLDKENGDCAQIPYDIADATAAATAAAADATAAAARAADACAARHPTLSDDCSVCFSGDSDACTRLINECGETDTCSNCYNDKNYAQCAQLAAIDACVSQHPGLETKCQECFEIGINAACAQLDDAASSDSDDAAAAIDACTASLTAANATLALAAQVCPEVQLGQNGDYSVGPLNCDRIHSVYQNNQCCGTC